MELLRKIRCSHSALRYDFSSFARIQLLTTIRFSSRILARESTFRSEGPPTLILLLRQDKIDHGMLIRWTKGFANPNTENHDVVAMFRQSLEKHVRHDGAVQRFNIDIYADHLECPCDGGRIDVRYNRNAYRVALCEPEDKDCMYLWNRV